MTTLLIQTESMPLMVNFPALVTMSDQQFYEFCLANRDLRIERTASGEVVIMPPAFSDTGNRNVKISQQLANWADQDGTGESFGSSSGFTLPNGATPSPDASWINLNRWNALGSATFRKAMKLRGLEPDECYCLDQKKEFPDLAIEIVLTSGLVNKLDIYQGLGVAEVWQWQDERFAIYHLRSIGYEQIERSELLPNLDVQQLASYVNPADQFDAVMTYRAMIRSLS